MYDSYLKIGNLKPYKLFTKILQTFLFRFSSAIISFFIIWLTARLLGADARGYLSLLVLSITLIITLNNFVGGPSLVYFVPRYADFEVLKISYLWGVAMCVAGCFLLFISSLIPQEMLLPVLLISFLQSITTIHHYFLLGKMKINGANSLAFIQPVFQLIYIGIIYFLDFLSVEQLVNSLYFSYGITALYSWFLIIPTKWKEFRKVNLSINKTIWKNVFRYGLVNQLANFSQLISYRAAYYFLHIIWGTAMLGVFSTATSIVESVWLISSSISLVQYADISNSTNKEYARETSLVLLKLSAILTIIALITLICLPAEFYVFLFGNEFKEIISCIIWLSPGIGCMAIGMIISHFFSGTGKNYYNALTSGIGMLVSISLAYFFIKRYSLLGACALSSLSYFVTSLLLLCIFIKTENVTASDFIKVSLKRYFFKNRF